jgi:hypothetical protein
MLASKGHYGHVYSLRKSTEHIALKERAKKVEVQKHMHLTAWFYTVIPA